MQHIKVLIYVDSIGCVSCKLKLSEWKEFIHEIDSVTDNNVPVLFFFHPKDEKDVKNALRKHKFVNPVCIDTDDQLNKLNNFSNEMTFQSFLLDKQNKVKVIGNPILNYRVKELYFEQMLGKEQHTIKQLQTTAKMDKVQVDFGRFSINEKKQAVFQLKNTGNSPLVILDVNASCGCMVVKYDKHPVSLGQFLNINVEMNPKDAGFFEETITVRCNILSSPFKLKIEGNAF